MVNTWRRRLAWCFSHAAVSAVASRRGNHLGTSGRREGGVWLSLPGVGDGAVALPGTGAALLPPLAKGR